MSSMDLKIKHKSPSSQQATSKSHKLLPSLIPKVSKPYGKFGKVYTKVELEGNEFKTSLSLATNRLEPIVPYRIASSKLPY